MSTPINTGVTVRLKFHLARLDSTRHIRRVEPMHLAVSS